MADPRFIAVYIPDTEPELQALVKGWRLDNVNVSGMVVQALKKTFIEPGDPTNVEIKRRLDEILDNVKTR